MPLTTRLSSAAAGTLPRRLLLSAVLSCLTLGAGASPGARASAPQAAEKARITSASGVRVRSAPETGAEELARLPLGQVVRELERTQRKSRVGEAEDYWYRVSAANGAEGWVFGALTEDYDPARRDEVYRRIAAARVANASATFVDLAETVRFLDRAIKEVTAREALAELELARLNALARSFASVGIEDLQKSPYREWTREREAEVVYSEPAGQYFVRSELFWNLQKKYADLPAGERIAWEASQVPLPGECEGYLPCHLFLETETSGRYLKLYPRGAHAAEALDNIIVLLSQVSEDLKGPQPVFAVAPEDRAEVRKTLAELRAQAAPVAHARRDEALKLIDEVARRFR